jgi:Mn-dependent DtxR family transcriptional regulator
MNRPLRTVDYLDAIDQFCRQRPESRAMTGKIAELLSLANGTVSSAMRELQRDDLIHLTPYKGCTLTPLGEKTLRLWRDRVERVANFLASTLSLPYTQSLIEARKIEADISEVLFEAIKRRESIR